jgi:hypothetical protein
MADWEKHFNEHSPKDIACPIHERQLRDQSIEFTEDSQIVVARSEYLAGGVNMHKCRNHRTCGPQIQLCRSADDDPITPRLARVLVDQHYHGLKPDFEMAPLHALHLARTLRRAKRGSGSVWPSNVGALFQNQSLCPAQIRAYVQLVERHCDFLDSFQQTKRNRDELLAVTRASDFWRDFRNLIPALANYGRNIP